MLFDPAECELRSENDEAIELNGTLLASGNHVLDSDGKVSFL